MAGRIPQTFIDDLIARTDIVEMIGRRVRLKRQGHEFAALCPFHDEKTPSFTVSPQKQFFHCFGCGAHGTPIGFLMRYENLEFPQAVERLADELGLEVPHEGGPANPHTEIFEALARAQRLFAATLKQTASAGEYLEKRGVSAAAIEQWGIGFAPPGGEVLLRTLGRQGVEEKILSGAGLVSRSERGAYDRFRDRITFPIRDTRGRVVAFGARGLGDAKPKYLNSPETPVFHKGNMLYGLYEARQRGQRLRRLVVVEGYMDVIALTTAGFEAAVATLGTAVTETQARRLFGAGADEVIYCFDGDAAGKRAAWRALEQTLPSLAPGREIRFVFLPSGDDPDSLVRREGLAAFEKTLESARPLSAWLIDHLAEAGVESAEARARFAGQFRPLVNRIRDAVFRDIMLSAAAERVGLPLERFERLMQAPAPGRGQPPSPGESTSRAESRPASSARPKAEPFDRRVQWLLRRLLAEPAAIAGEPWPTALDGVQLAGLAVVRDMLEILANRPQISTAGLLEHWRERPEAAQLGRLVAASPLLLSAEQVAAEFHDGLKELERAPRQARLALLERQSAQRALGEAERQELRLLHRIRALESRAERNAAEQADFERLQAEYRGKYRPEVPETP